MTIPEKRAALIAAKIKVGEKATGFVIETLFEKHKDKLQAQDLTSMDVAEVVLDPEPDPVIESHNEPQQTYTPPACIARACEIGMRMGGEWNGFPATTSTDVPFSDVLARHHDNVLAERNPPVVAWAMRNLCEEDFITRYGNRKFDF